MSARVRYSFKSTVGKAGVGIVMRKDGFSQVFPNLNVNVLVKRFKRRCGTKPPTRVDVVVRKAR